jgi:type VI secretion system protein ImpH
VTTMLEIPSAGVSTVEPAVEPSTTPARAPLPNDGPLAELMTDAAGFDFFQAVRLLELHMPGALDRSPLTLGHEPRVSIAPHDGLAFPAADVHSVETFAGDAPSLRLLVTFFGLYGVDSPLPSYFGSAASEEESRALRAFLDIFSHRLYVLLYESWKKYRVPLGEIGGDGPHLQRLMCLAGLGAPAQAGSIPARRLLPLAATLRNEVRNADGLRRLIEAFFPELRVAITQNVPRWVAVANRDRPRIGRRSDRSVLGDTAFLGEKLLDVSGRFRIVLGPLTWAQFKAFHPGGDAARLLADLVALYVRDTLDYDVELRIGTAELPITRLGSPSNHLGLTTWAGKPADTIVSELVEYAAHTRPAVRHGRTTLQ